jgi:uncharacterized membrane protein YeaQ/YmgE (transglycosylase-associated protein family)
MDWIISLIIGGIVGWLASIVMKTNAQMGIIANVLVGVVGSLLGNWVAGALGLAPSGGILRFVIALIGAVVLIFILRALGIFKKTDAGR